MTQRAITLSGLLLFASIAIGVVGVALALADLLRPPAIGDWPAWPSWLPWVGVTAGVLGLLAARLIERREHALAHDTPEAFLDPGQEARLVEAIRAFESRTSGEIRVHLAYDCDGDPRDAALAAFERLGMRRTRQRNAVLLYVAVHARRLAVIGDEGIHRAVDPEFWERTVRTIERAFGDGDRVGGLRRGIELAGEALVERFPPDPDDTNELPDRPSRS